MQLQLTPDEEQELVWQKGDWFEILYGNLTFTYSEPVRDSVEMHLQYYEVRFFFDANGQGGWANSEWAMNSTGTVQNGPGLLVLYRRGNQANVFGAISRTNRAWILTAPLIGMESYSRSTVARNMKLAGFSRFLGRSVFVIAIVAAMIWFVSANQGSNISSILGGLLLILPWPLVIGFAVYINLPKGNRRFRNLLAGRDLKKVEATETVARALMHRLSSADLPNEQSKQGGRLSSGR